MTSVATAAAAVAALLATASPGAAHAEPCPDVEVVFARGTNEPPGIGRVGEAFVSALAQRAGDRSVQPYAVDYPASYNFLSAADGANDASARIQELAARCPDSELVLGGYSQGAAIIDVLALVPFAALGFTAPLPPQVADHVVALAVFGNPSAKFGRPLTSSPVYGPKSIDLCNGGDPVCSDGNNVAAHRDYTSTGLTSQAADFVAGLI